MVGCATHAAYGPSSDERLEAALSSGHSREGADVAGISCSELGRRLREAKSDDRPEGDRLQALMEIHRIAQERVNRLDAAVVRNPDLVYSADGDAIKNNLEGCRSFYADVRSDFDRYVREIVDLPVIQEVRGRETVNVARLDLGLLRKAINALDPDDRDVLLGRVDGAEKKINGR